MGFGFTIALTMLGAVREVLGAGTFLGVHLFGKSFEPWVLFLLPPGGFISLAMWLLLFAWWKERSAERAAIKESAPTELAVPVEARA